MATKSQFNLPDGNSSVKPRPGRARTGLGPSRPSDEGYCHRCRSDRPHIGFVKDGAPACFVSFETSIEIALRVDGCGVGAPSTMRSYMADTPRGHANLFPMKRRANGGIELDSCGTHLWAEEKAGIDVARFRRKIDLYDAALAARSRCTPQTLCTTKEAITATHRKSEEFIQAARSGRRDERALILDLHHTFVRFNEQLLLWYDEFYFDPKRETFAEPEGRLNKRHNDDSHTDDDGGEGTER